MTRTAIPLGQKESERLELKGAKALDKKETIAREVVAMLNGVDQGEVWVGLRDEEERAVAVEPIPKPDVARRALQDSLIDSIEPPLTHDEVRVEVVRDERAQAVLRVVVQANQARRPFALLGAGGSRMFVTRVGARNRPMSREEIRSAMSGTKPGGSDVDHAVKQLLDARQQAPEQGLWMQLQPWPALDLDLQDDNLWDLLQSPEKSGNRRVGPVFTAPSRPELRGDSLQAGPGETWSTCVYRNGTVRYKCLLQHVMYRRARIHEYDLLELPIALCRLSGAIWRHSLDADGIVAADLALFGIRGYGLDSRRAMPVGGPWRRLPHSFDVNDLLLPKPLIFTAMEAIEEPDRCGFRLVRDIYQVGDLLETAIPPEYDRTAGRLMLSD